MGSSVDIDNSLIIFQYDFKHVGEAGCITGSEPCDKIPKT